VPRLSGAAVFFDRDGVLNRLVEREGRFVSPRTLEQFDCVPMAQPLLRRFSERSIPTFVVTNQPDIARGKMRLDTLQMMHERLRSEVRLTDIAFCPHDDQQNCACRKPKAGMLFELAERWDVSLRASIMIGDSWRDAAAGRNAGCTTILIEGPEAGDASADFRVASLAEAADVAMSHVWR
jgi:D-glycero-D-manno-heptose 1,7-bisphosphate phosphatase